jgi:hypothetical protein
VKIHLASKVESRLQRASWAIGLAGCTLNEKASLGVLSRKRLKAYHQHATATNAGYRPVASAFIRTGIVAAHGPTSNHPCRNVGCALWVLSDDGASENSTPIGCWQVSDSDRRRRGKGERMGSD